MSVARIVSPAARAVFKSYTNIIAPAGGGTYLATGASKIRLQTEARGNKSHKTIKAPAGGDTDYC